MMADLMAALMVVGRAEMKDFEKVFYLVDDSAALKVAGMVVVTDAYTAESREIFAVASLEIWMVLVEADVMVAL